jgi:L-seryl-tRNA(Ser) seleniumtransferase
MTSLGSSSVSEEIISSMAEVLPMFVDIYRLQCRASEVIARVTGAEAGCVTCCSAAGIAVSVATTMVGDDLALAERLPLEAGERREVVLQKGHSVWFGGALPQMIRLAGASVVEIGHATRAGAYQLKSALTERTACSVYVISHHAASYGMIPLDEFVRVCHARGVPVVVDAASEIAMREITASGADLVCFSGHKFLGGPTSGIVAGRRDLIRGCLVNSQFGIGRAMKAGKEAIVGAMAALSRWEDLDKDEERARQDRVLEAYHGPLSETHGLAVQYVDDPTGNPIRRLRIRIDPHAAGLTAFQTAQALKDHKTPIYVRDDEIDLGYFDLDPCNVTLDEAHEVGSAIAELLTLERYAKDSIKQKYHTPANVADSLERSISQPDSDSPIL